VILNPSLVLLLLEKNPDPLLKEEQGAVVVAGILSVAQQNQKNIRGVASNNKN